MSEDAQDKRPAANHVGFFARGRYAEEMLVHAEDGTLLGKLLSNHVPTRAESGVVFASIEFTREDVVKRMATGYQL